MMFRNHNYINLIQEDIFIEFGKPQDFCAFLD